MVTESLRRATLLNGARDDRATEKRRRPLVTGRLERSVAGTKKHDGDGWVYLLVADALRRFKIGYTGTPGFGRPHDQSVEGAADVRLVAMRGVPGCADAAAKRAFRRWLVRGKYEWYHADPVSTRLACGFFNVSLASFSEANLFDALEPAPWDPAAALPDRHEAFAVRYILSFGRKFPKSADLLTQAVRAVYDESAAAEPDVGAGPMLSRVSGPVDPGPEQ